jgi:homoserine O-acetyltransferase/O-succinyltransferase
MLRFARAAAVAVALVSTSLLSSTSLISPASAQALMTEKKTLEIPSFTTQGGRTLKGVKIGWESYGTLNADKSNAILICHFFSGTSHAAGKYKESDAAPGYWDAIIGPGKAIDTNKYFVISADTLVNLGAHDPNVVTTGPASVNPDTGKPYGMDFPIVSIADFVETQKKLADSLGIKKFQLVAGASMGGLQTYEWAARYPDMVARAMPVISFGEADASLIAWLDIWASPIKLDPNWNGGDYYGKTPPNAGLATALKIVTLHAQHWDWANKTFGRKPAKEGENPASGFDKRYLIEQTLDNAGAARAKISDANHFLYLAKANQTFVAGGAGTLEEGIKKIKAPVLLIHSPKDLVFPPGGVDDTAAKLKANGVKVEQIQLKGDRGHLDGVVSMKQAEETIRAFIAR